MNTDETIQLKSKRGRKKKWESSSIKNYSINVCESVVFGEYDKNPDIVKDSSNGDNLKFGNLTIKVKGKEKTNFNITDFLNK